MNSTSLHCPSCGGPLNGVLEPGRLRCGGCSSHWLELGHDDVRALRPRDILQAADVDAALMSGLAAEGISRPRIRRRQQMLLPFWQMRAQLVGWVRYRPARVEGEERRAEEQEDMVARPVSLSIPGCDSRSFGLSGIADRADRLPWMPLDAEGMEGGLEAWTLCAITVPREIVLRRGRLTASGGLLPPGAIAGPQRLSLIRPELEVLYYPIHVLDYSVYGRPHRAVVDGVRGTLLQWSYSRPYPGHAPSWLAMATAGGLLAGLDPGLGVFGLGAMLMWKAREAGLGGDPQQWASWLSRELGGQDSQVVRIEGGRAR